MPTITAPHTTRVPAPIPGPFVSAPDTNLACTRQPSFEGHYIFDGARICRAVIPSLGPDLLRVDEAHGMLKEDFLQRVHPADRSYTTLFDKARKANATTFKAVYRYMSTAGDYRWRQDTVQLGYDDRSEFSRALITSIDVTAQVELEDLALTAMRVSADLYIEVDAVGHVHAIGMPGLPGLRDAHGLRLAHNVSGTVPDPVASIFLRSIEIALLDGVCEQIHYNIGNQLYCLNAARKPAPMDCTSEWRCLLLVRKLENPLLQNVESAREVPLDFITGLPTRSILLDRLTNGIGMTVPNTHWVAFLLLNLDHVKGINHFFGPNTGDALLNEAATRLRRVIPKGALLARAGAHEFAVLLQETCCTESAMAVHANKLATGILQTFSAAFSLEGTEYRITPSIGIAYTSSAAEKPSDIFHRADTAMQHAKDAGRNCVRFYDRSIQELIYHRQTVESELHGAAQRGEVVTYLQPIVNKTRDIQGFEALARWQHPSKGIIMPEEFIQIAEQSSLINIIGAAVLRDSCSQLAEWSQDPIRRHWTISVNVSPRQVEADSFVADVIAALDEFQVPKGHLRIELTESVLHSDIDALVGKMHALIAAGVTFSLDDFGTGYSSLTYLKRLPLSQLKIDRSFINDIPQCPQDSAIATSIIQLAVAMNITVVAEGIETDEQLVTLSEMGCTSYQGFLLGNPAPLNRPSK